MRKFEFSMEAESKLEKDAVFDLYAHGPKGWDINFKPPYETKYISSLRLQSSRNQTVAVEVKPALMAPPVNIPSAFGSIPVTPKVRRNGLLFGILRWLGRR